MHTGGMAVSGGMTLRSGDIDAVGAINLPGVTVSSAGMIDTNAGINVGKLDSGIFTCLH